MYDALNIIRYLTFCFVLVLNLQEQMESGNNETRGFLEIGLDIVLIVTENFWCHVQR